MSYCTRSDIEARFGTANVAKWADMTNDGDTTAITAMIDRAIAVASAEIDDRLRDGPYTLPFAAPAPVAVVEVAVMLAAVWLYESKGVQDMNEVTGQPIHRLSWHRKRAEQVLAELKAGRTLRLDATRYGRATNVPIVG